MANAPARAGSGKLDALQVLRALAASMVVVGHVISGTRHHDGVFSPLPPLPFAGGAAVEVFFLISGFIMVYASSRLFGSVAGSIEFVKRRLVRIVPFYWAVTLLFVLLAVAQGERLPSATAIASSFLFIPYDTLGEQNGFAFPLVSLGWTLNYEMLFYVLFALFIPFGRTATLYCAGASMVALVMFGLIAQPQNVALRFWTQPLILEFGVGMVLAVIHMRRPIALPVWLRLAMVGLGIVIYVADPLALMRTTITANDFVRFAGWGIPALLVFVAGISGPVPLDSAFGRLIVLLGDSSYALYLLHPFAIAAMMRIANRGIFAGVAGTTAFVLVTPLVAALGAIVVHRFVERPFTARLTKLVQRREDQLRTVPMPPDARIK